MNPWIAKAVILAASIVLVAIRAPTAKRSSAVKIVKDRKGRPEVGKRRPGMLGFFVPLIWVASPLFAFAEYRLRVGPFVGVACYIVGLFWLFYRSHADLGTNWSITLQVRRSTASSQRCNNAAPPDVRAVPVLHRASTQGTGWWVRPTWSRSGSSTPFRVHAEEKMMLEEFGGDYAAYVANT